MAGAWSASYTSVGPSPGEAAADATRKWCHSVPCPRKIPTDSPQRRAVRLGAMRDAAEGRGPVAGQECECHRHLLDIEQSQPVKPGSPLSVGLRPVLINGQRAFHTKILSARALAATTDAPSWPACRDRSATRPRPSRDRECNQIATESQLSVTFCRDNHASSGVSRRAPRCNTARELAEAVESRIFRVSSPSRQPKDVFSCPESGTIEPVRSKLVDADPASWLRNDRPRSATTRYGAPMDETYPQDLISNVAASTGLPEATASRVVADVAAYFGETVDEFVRRRHAELQDKSNKRNDDIWPQLAAELARPPVPGRGAVRTPAPPHRLRITARKAARSSKKAQQSSAQELSIGRGRDTVTCAGSSVMSASGM